MRVACMIQARMGSTRLPGKVLKEINGMPLIQHIWRRLLRCNGIDVAMVSIGRDAQSRYFDLVGFCVNNGIPTDVGTAENVIGRMLNVGRTAFAGAVVRVTGDCLFHDPAQIDLGIMKFVSEWPKHSALFSWPRRAVSEGLDFEVWSTELLAKLDKRTDVDRESVAQWAWDRREELGVGSLYPHCEENPGDPHLSIDTQEDVERAEKMLAVLGNDKWRWVDTQAAWRKVDGPKIEIARA